MPIRAFSVRSAWPFLLFLCLACLFLWRVVFTGEVFVPAELLRHLDPWRSGYGLENLPAWNGLMYDAVGQFYPWRNFAAESIRAGVIPLWNPYQFCGAPFVANSQSAVLYPGNLVFYVMPVATAAGWSVILHLAMAAAFTWVFMRGLGAGVAAAAFSGIAFAFSTWQVAWLHLPTFLATSCWLPLVLHLVGKLIRQPSVKRSGILGFTIGLCLLAGHLQIAFYVLLAASLYALHVLFHRRHEAPKPRALPAAGLFTLSVILGAMLAGPQLLPSLELSKRSHRVSRPTEAGYAAYVDYAPTPSALGTLFLPDMFGNPSRKDAPYIGETRSGKLFNYAEGAMYVGIITLLLAGIGLFRRADGHSSAALYLGALAGLSLLMAFGNPVDAFLYFHVPGFAQSGSPGRALVLWTFAASALSGLGIDVLLSEKRRTYRVELIVLLGAVVLFIFFIALAPRLHQLIGGESWTNDMIRQAGFFALSVGAVIALIAGKRGRIWTAIPCLLLTADLFATGLNYNPTAARADVYPPTPLIEYLAARAGHDRIMPVNQGWSFQGPRAVLPPNGSMVYGLRDLQGYDSLFPGQYKAFMNRLAMPASDASPAEVGNMVFAKNPTSPLAGLCGVRYVVSRSPLTLPDAQESFIDQNYVYELRKASGRASARTAFKEGHIIPVEWIEDRPNLVAISSGDSTSPVDVTLADEQYPGWHATMDGVETPMKRTDDIFRQVRVPSGRHIVQFEFKPASFRVGLYLMLAAAAAICGFAAAVRRQ